MSEAAVEKPVGLAERVLPFLAVALMLIVAVIHQINVRANDLTPDVGGGFGMFAFVDNTMWRTVIVTIEDVEGRAWTLDLETRGRDLELSDREVQRVAALPSPGTLASTAELVRTVPWYVDESGSDITTAVEEGSQPLQIADVTLMVYGVEYHLDDDEVRRRVIASWPAGS